MFFLLQNITSFKYKPHFQKLKKTCLLLKKHKPPPIQTHTCGHKALRAGSFFLVPFLGYSEVHLAPSKLHIDYLLAQWFCSHVRRWNFTGNWTVYPLIGCGDGNLHVLSKKNWANREKVNWNHFNLVQMKVITMKLNSLLTIHLGKWD